MHEDNFNIKVPRSGADEFKLPSTDTAIVEEEEIKKEKAVRKKKKAEEGDQKTNGIGPKKLKSKYKNRSVGLTMERTCCSCR